MIPDKDLIIFFGDCGKGKTSLMLHFADEYIKMQGTERWSLSEYVIRGLNEQRKKAIEYPSKPVIYSNFTFNLKDKKGQEIKPVAVEGKDIGINNESEKDYKYLFPASLLIMDEAHTEFCSKGEPLPRGQRDFFNKRRHNRLKIMLASPRAVLINKDIRNSGAYGIEVRQMENEYSVFRTLIKSKWYCREFEEKSELELYIKSDGEDGRYIETEYEHKGNIFDLYDSFAFVKDFAPPEGGEYLI